MASMKTVKSATIYVLELDEEEAGYLKDLLAAHVGGTLTTDRQPLGRIRVALEDVPRLHAVNSRISGAYAVLGR